MKRLDGPAAGAAMVVVLLTATLLFVGVITSDFQTATKWLLAAAVVGFCGSAFVTLVNGDRH